MPVEQGKLVKKKDFAVGIGTFGSKYFIVEAFVFSLLFKIVIVFTVANSKSVKAEPSRKVVIC